MRTTRSSTEFAGKVALVTGASSFLATAVITQLVEAGARVVLADVNEEICSEIAQSLGESVRFVRTDVTIDADLERLVDTAVTEFGGVDLVVSAAAVFDDGQLDSTREQWRRALDVVALLLLYRRTVMQSNSQQIATS